MSKVCKRCVEVVADSTTSCPACGGATFEAGDPTMMPAEQVPAMVFTGPPVTPEMQLLFGCYGGGNVTGVLQLREGLVVAYDTGVQLTFAPFHSGGRIGGSGESRGLAGAQVIGGCCG